jgi:predicted phosphodiesterase
MKFALMSDIHMEFWPDPETLMADIIRVTPECDVIALAGDIGVLANNYDHLQKFIEELSSKGDVIYVSGNHEFYGRAFECGLEDLFRLRSSFKTNRKVQIIDGAPRWVKIGDYNFLVGTLWFEDLLPTAEEKGWLNDFRVKRIEDYIYDLNSQFVRMLRLTDKKNIVTISHHSPTYASTDPKFKGNPLNQFFCNNLDYLLEERGVVLSCHGHLHDPVDYQLGCTRVCSAPMGYPGEIASTWKPKIIELP